MLRGWAVYYYDTGDWTEFFYDRNWYLGQRSDADPAGVRIFYERDAADDWCAQQDHAEVVPVRLHPEPRVEGD